MSSLPLVSIIMNCYNSDRFLRLAIDSVYSQSYTNWEIIFWDNASTDDSAKIALSYDNKLKYYRSSHTTSLGEARRHALANASGDYIAFLDCDDMYLPQKLFLQVELMENNDFALVYSSAIIINECGDKLRKHIARYNSGYVFPNLLGRYEINMQTVMLRKSIFDVTGLTFDNSFTYCPDYNLFMQIAAQFNVGVIKDALVKYRLTPNSLSSQTVELASFEIKSSLDHLFTSFPELRKKYNNQVDAAYDKLNYYDAIAYIYKSNYILARKKIKKIIYKRWSYLTLYLILWFPFPKSIILRPLKR